jgi:hypothetical protein
MKRIIFFSLAAALRLVCVFGNPNGSLISRVNGQNERDPLIVPGIRQPTITELAEPLWPFLAYRR